MAEHGRKAAMNFQAILAAAQEGEKALVAELNAKRSDPLDPLTLGALMAMRDMQRFHQRLYSFLLKTREIAESNPLNQGIRADVAYCLREVHQWADDLRKEAASLRELLDQLICVQWVQEGQNDPENQARSVRGRFALATPNVRMAAVVPSKSKDEEGYNKVMSGLGVPQELVEAGVLSAHWVRLGEWLSERMSKGEPLPEGVDLNKTQPVYSTALRKNTKGAAPESFLP